ncbi:MAG: hypothetical protein U0V87_08330 [Acidobacteriota bacterium]
MGILDKLLAEGRTRLVLALVAVASTALVPSLPRSEEPDSLADPTFDDASRERRPPLDSAKLAALIVSIDERAKLVRTMIVQASRSYREGAMRRAEAERRLAAAEDGLDRELVRAKDLSSERLDELVEAVRQARAQAASSREITDRRIDEVWRLIHERDALMVRLTELRGARPTGQEPLTGVWDLVWMPGSIAGTLYLDQSGTLVTGQYKLSNGMSGSLQGTFVNGKLYLQRIDAVRGRDAEIEGALDSDGLRLRGTWQNFELVQGGLPRGQWTARRAP